MITTPARLIGLGVGPGDPDLLTVKAVRFIEAADVIAHFCKAGNASQARRAAERYIRPDAIEVSLGYPVTREIPKQDPRYGLQIGEFYDSAAQVLASHLDMGRLVVVLSEGDPLFYGSYMHLHVRLAAAYKTEVIPGITSLSGCWSQAGVPIAQGEDVLSIVPGMLPEDELEQRLYGCDAIVLIKIGAHLAKVRRVLNRCGRMAGAIYVERGTMPEAKCIPLERFKEPEAPYFALVLVPGWAGRR